MYQSQSGFDHAGTAHHPPPAVRDDSVRAGERVVAMGREGRPGGASPHDPTARIREIVFAAAMLFAALTACPHPVLAEDAGPGAIKGVDAMGDKGTSALDGFSEAPVPREESAAMGAPNPGGHSIAEEEVRPVPPARIEPGQDPQAPAPVVLPGPANNVPAGP